MMSISSDSDGSSSPEPDFLFPNGFQDVAVENVPLHIFRDNSSEYTLPRQDSEDSVSGKRKTRSAGKKNTPKKKRKLDESLDILESSEPLDVSETITNCPDEDSSKVIVSEASMISQREDVVDLDEVPTPSPPDASYNFNESVSLSDDESAADVEALSEVKDVNPVIPVRVLWRAGKIEIFNIRKFQKIKEIYTHFSNLEGVSEERILFTLKEREVCPDDTPDSLSIGYRFLEGGIIDVIKPGLPKKVQHDPNSLELKIQQRGVREKISIFIKKEDTMQVLISKLAEELNVPAQNIILRFDGDLLSPEETPSSLDLEGGECLDLVVKS